MAADIHQHDMEGDRSRGNITASVIWLLPHPTHYVILMSIRIHSSALLQTLALVMKHATGLCPRQSYQRLLSFLQSPHDGIPAFAGMTGRLYSRQKNTTASVIWLLPRPTHCVILMSIRIHHCASPQSTNEFLEHNMSPPRVFHRLDNSHIAT